MNYFKKSFLFFIFLFALEVGVAKDMNVASTSENDAILLNKFYELQKNDPKQAQKVLVELIKQNPSNVTAQLEMGYLLISQKKNKEAVPYFQTATKLDSSNRRAKLQLTYLLTEKDNKTTSGGSGSTLLDKFYALQKKDPKKAQKVLLELIKQNPSNVTAQLEMGYLLVSQKKNKEAIPYFQTATKLDPSNRHTKLQLSYLVAEKNNKTTSGGTGSTLLDKFHALQKKNPQQAEQVLKQYIAQNPCDPKAMLEMVYFLMKQKRNKEALCYCQIAERLELCNFETKLQVAYLLNDMGRNREAYYKFKEVTYSPDCKKRLKGEESMVSLAGEQTKILRKPYFIDFYASPFRMSRFKDYIFPEQLRAGINYGQNNQGELYSIIRYNRDTQSGIDSGAPAIYQDNSVDYALGTTYQPFEKIPIYGYIELGRAYELVTNEHGRRWKPDFRYGISGYTAYGAPAVYSPCLTFQHKFVGDIYGDFSYYSRYIHDGIGQLRVRPGIRALTYHNSSLDFYVRVNTLFDTQRLFYNNILEVGPGIAFTPDNRFNLVLRVEGTLGYYLPINSSQPNPYANIYRMAVVQLETYIRF